MSTLPDPNQDRPQAEQTLTAREQAILADIAGRENATDPGFVTRLGSGRGGASQPEGADEVAARARLRDRLIQGLVVVALAALLLPSAWFATAALVLTLLVVPGLLVLVAWREQQHAATQRGPDPDGPDGRQGHDASPDR